MPQFSTIIIVIYVHKFDFPEERQPYAGEKPLKYDAHYVICSPYFIPEYDRGDTGFVA